MSCVSVSWYYIVCCMFQLTKNTTPMYRAPEMLDLYQNYPINEQSDIWVSSCYAIQFSYYSMYNVTS